METVLLLFCHLDCKQMSCVQLGFVALTSITKTCHWPNFQLPCCIVGDVGTTGVFNWHKLFWCSLKTKMSSWDVAIKTASFIFSWLLLRSSCWLHALSSSSMCFCRRCWRTLCILAWDIRECEARPMMTWWMNLWRLCQTGTITLTLNSSFAHSLHTVCYCHFNTDSTWCC